MLWLGRRWNIPWWLPQSEWLARTAPTVSLEVEEVSVYSMKSVFSVFQKRNTRCARCRATGLRQGFACGDVAKSAPIVLITPPAQQLPSAVSFPALLLFPAGLGFCPVNQNSPTFDPSPPVMYMRNVTCDKELSEEQRVKAPVTAVPPPPAPGQRRSLLTCCPPGTPCPLPSSHLLQSPKQKRTVNNQVFFRWHHSEKTTQLMLRTNKDPKLSALSQALGSASDLFHSWESSEIQTHLAPLPARQAGSAGLPCQSCLQR